MDVTYLIQLLQNKIGILNNAKSQAFMVGDLDRLNVLDKDLMDTQNTLTQLNLLASINTAAAAANTTSTDLVASSIDIAQNTPDSIQGPTASALINGFNVSAYATDALYEQKIHTILAGIPLSMDATGIDAYIQDKAPGAPVTGSMILASATEFSVDVPLMIAIMQNDSAFGTLGVGATTNNPGNVGNTGTATRTFASWADGVSAVAQWLNNHRIAPPVTPVAETPVVPPTPTPAPVPQPVTLPPVTPSVAEVTPPPAPETPVVIPSITAPDMGTSSTTTATSTDILTN